MLSESGIESRLDVLTIRGLTPLVGREQEVRCARRTLGTSEAWARTSRHTQWGSWHWQITSGSGAHRSPTADEPHTRLECQSSPYYQNTALYPIVDLWHRICAFCMHGSPDHRIEKLECTLRQYRIPLGESVPLFASLLSLLLAGDHSPPLALSPQRQKLLETITHHAPKLAEPKPTALYP